VLGALSAKLRLISKPMGKPQFSLYTQFFLKPPACGNAIRLATARMTAAGIRPVIGPERFVGAALLQLHDTRFVKQKDGASLVQGARALV